MDFHVDDNHRSDSGISILSYLLAVCSGVFFGIGASATKIIMSSMLNAINIIALLQNPFAWCLAIFGISGFLMLQKAYRIGKIVTVTSISTGMAIIIPVLFGIFYLNEIVSFLKLLGILFIIIGVICLGVYKPS